MVSYRSMVQTRAPRWCWGTEPEFQNRLVQTIHQDGTGKVRAIAERPVPDGLILCDACGKEVRERPFVVVPSLVIGVARGQGFVTGGDFALCPACARKWGVPARPEELEW